MLHIVESRKPLDRVAKDLDAVVAHHKFGVFGPHDLKAKMAEKDAGVTKLATMKPTAMIDLFATAGLQDVAKEVEVTLIAIMAEAAH
jgi:hypothetical protein